MASKALVISTVICLFTAAGPAYSGEALTWEECLREAKENNPDLLSAGEEVRQVKADRDVDLSGMLPQVDAGADRDRTRSTSKRITDTYSYSITGRQLLFDGFKTASELSNALKTIQAQQYSYNVTSSDVRLDLRSAFVGLMKAQELVSLTENIAERRKQNLELINLRYKSGREHRGALLTAEADMAQAEFEAEQAKRGIFLSRRELLKAIGVSEMSPFKAEGGFLLEGEYERKPDFARLAETTPFLRELILKKEAARYNLNSKQADFFPKVYLAGSAGKTGGDWPPEGEQWSAGVSVSLPLFEGGSRIAEASKARSQLKQAGEDEKSGRYGALVTLEREWKDLRDAIENVSVQKKFLEAARERAKITKSQYEIGLASFNDWVIIEDNLVRARKSYLNAQADMLIAEAYWIQAIGGTLEYGQK
ncbi:MAG: TolC family protein [Candidatus Omnitrophota bacterium]